MSKSGQCENSILKKAAVKYVCEIVSKAWKSNQEIMIDKKSIVRNPNYYLPIVDDVKAELDDDSRIKIQGFFAKDEEINNIYNLLTQFVEIIRNKYR